MDLLLFHQRADRLQLFGVAVSDHGDPLAFFKDVAKIFGGDRKMLGNFLLRDRHMNVSLDIFLCAPRINRLARDVLLADASVTAVDLAKQRQKDRRALCRGLLEGQGIVNQLLDQLLGGLGLSACGGDKGEIQPLEVICKGRPRKLRKNGAVCVKGIGKNVNFRAAVGKTEDVPRACGILLPLVRNVKRALGDEGYLNAVALFREQIVIGLCAVCVREFDAGHRFDFNGFHIGILLR